MKTLSNLISGLRRVYGADFTLSYAHPLMYLVCKDPAFEKLDEEGRRLSLAKRLGWEPEELDEVTSHGVAQLLLLTNEESKTGFEFLQGHHGGAHWLSWFSRDEHSLGSSHVIEHEGQSKAVHFYGFKGGQARSTVLIMLAKALADEGSKVLLVDADVEAPSLDALLDSSAEDVASTLMGACGWSAHLHPLARVYVGQAAQGTVDLLACRPRDGDYDLDFAGFLLSTTFDARILESASKKLRALADRESYDFVLFDHRTGLAPSVLPIIQGWPGPGVVFARPDGMSRGLENSGVLEALLNRGSDSPGAFVTFSLDPKETRAGFVERNGKFVERLLESLSDAITSGDDQDGAPIDPVELERYWILWHHDPSLLAKAAPTPSQLSVDNAEALRQLREVLGIKALAKRNLEPVVLTKSGATDQGEFILTPDIARLFSIDSKILYVFGRKGTGKTRLVRELHERGLGTPLLVAQDFTSAGLQSSGALFRSLLSACGEDYELFWWVLLRESLWEEHGLQALASMGEEELRQIGSPGALERDLNSRNESKPRVFLIDGVETAVPASRMRAFVEALFRFLASVQYSRSLSRVITVRLFLRSDLQRGAVQNVEQQVEGSSLILRWDRVSILNFAVARIASLGWFRENFAHVCARIDENMVAIRKGALSESDAESILLEIFPHSLERNRVKTTTFFATYFSDAGGESEAKASFYPRLFDGFLREMDKRGGGTDFPSIDNGRVASAFVLAAYDEASRAFIEEVKSELFNLIDLAQEDSANRDAVNGLVSAFVGLRTPFVLDQMIVALSERTKLSTDKLRDSLERMKQLGMFEDRPGFPGEWRTGRLYKSGLQMKYVR